MKIDDDSRNFVIGALWAVSPVLLVLAIFAVAVLT